MGPIEEHLELTAAEVQEWLGLSSPPSLTSGMIALLVKTAKQMADKYCNNPFIDPDDEDEVLIPDGVKTGVLQVITDLYKSWQDSKGGSTDSGVVLKKKVGDMEIQFADPSSSVAASSDLSMFAQNLLDIYRIMPL